jgi:hypothetical protein
MKALLTLLVVLAIVVPASALTIDFGGIGQTTAIAGAENFSIADATGSVSASQTFGSNTVTLTAQNDLSAGGVGLPILYGRGDASMALGDAYKYTIRGSVGTSSTNPLGIFANTTPNVGKERPSMKIEVTGLAASTSYDVGLGVWYKWAGNQPFVLSGIGTPVTATFNWAGTPDASVAGNVPNMNGVFSTDADGKLAVTLAIDYSGTYAGDPTYGIGLLTVVPEPATMALLVLGGLAALRRRR